MRPILVPVATNTRLLLPTVRPIARGVQRIPTHQNQPDPTQPIRLGRFLGVGGLGWVMNFFFKQWVGMGLGHVIYELA